VEAAIYAMLHRSAPPGAAAAAGEFRPGQRFLRFDSPDGAVIVEIAPENAKLGINQAPADQLAALFALLEETPEASRELADAIVDWRAPKRSSVDSPFDLFYSALPEPYSAPHVGFQELEELLAVKGMSRDLFFGRLVETPEGTWRRLPALADLLTTEPNLYGINLAYAPEQVLRVLPGWDAALAEEVVRVRAQTAFGSLDELLAVVPRLATISSLTPVTLAPSMLYTLTATAWLGDSRVPARTVRARVRIDRALPLAHRVAAWWSEWPWSPAATPEGVLYAPGGSRS
jgi:type II secretory pathway component PulK